MKNTFILGCFLVAAANSFVGFNIIATKYLIQSLPMSILLELRYFFGCLCLVPIILFTKNKFKFFLSHERYTNRQRLIYVCMALSGGAVFNGIFILGMKNTTAMATGVIGSTLPILVVAFSVVFLNQKFKIMHAICAFFVALGIFFITLGSTQNQSVLSVFTNSQIPNLIVFIAMIPEAMFLIFAKMLPQKIAPLVSAFYINLINLIVCTPFFISTLFHFSFFSISSFEFFLCFLIGLISGALFYTLYASGMSKINAQTAGLITGVVPISTTILAVSILKEPFGVFSMVGMVFVLLSIYLGVYTEPKKA